MAATTDLILTTCPRDCYDSCGVAVRIRDGTIAQVRGDPDHPMSRGALCAKCSAGYNNEWLDPAVRLTRPLRRIGPKGAGRLRARLVGRGHRDDRRPAAARSSPAAGRTRSSTPTTAARSRCSPTSFRCASSTAWAPPRSSPTASATWPATSRWPTSIGTSFDGFDPRTVRDAACIVVWGANPSASAPHAFEHWFRPAPGTKIVVDPIRTETAKAADLHLQPFPGSDAALAFALLHVLRRDGLIDRDFIARHTVGWDELEPLLDDCTPAWGEATTGVPAALIEQAARLYGRGPSLLWLGQGLQRQPTGGNVMRACALLPAATGNLGKPGAGFLYLNWFNARGVDEAYLTAAAPEPGACHPSAIWTWPSASPTRRARRRSSAGTSTSRPRVRASEQLRQALRREDLFTVVLDLFQTDTADFADIVLPAASFLEFDDLFAPYFQLTALGPGQGDRAAGRGAAQPGDLPPPGPRHGLHRAGAVRVRRRHHRHRAARLRPGGGLRGARGQGQRAGLGTSRVIQFADLTFPTPSGRIEIASARAEADGHPRVPLPLADPRPADGRLRLLSPASTFTLNDSFANVAKLARRAGPPTVALHPADAAARGLAGGRRGACCPTRPAA